MLISVCLMLLTETILLLTVTILVTEAILLLTETILVKHAAQHVPSHLARQAVDLRHLHPHHTVQRSITHPSTTIC